MNILRRLYDWVLGWAETRYGTPALFILAFSESSFFPVAPDILLIALAMGKPRKSLYFALVCLIGSVLGGIFGYFIGMQLMDYFGGWLFDLYGGMHYYERISELYHNYDAWAVFIAGFTPIPYKIFTISAGMFHINFGVFVIASALGRGGRFFIVAALIFFFGPKIKAYIDNYFNSAVIIFTILLIGGFIIVKLILQQ